MPYKHEVVGSNPASPIPEELLARLGTGKDIIARPRFSSPEYLSAGA